jgi:15-hydroxyprostaglandin dehydrogenase (NAD)
MGLRLTQLQEPITVNCICPGLVRTNIMPDAITQATLSEFITPFSTVVRAVETFILDEKEMFQEQVAECIAQDVSMRLLNEYKDGATRFFYSSTAASKPDKTQLAKQFKKKQMALSHSIASTSTSP